MTTPSAPARYRRPNGLLCWIQSLRNKEFDAYTGQFVRKGWIAERERLVSIGSSTLSVLTCNLCKKPMSEHVPMRMWVADPQYCPSGEGSSS